MDAQMTRTEGHHYDHNALHHSGGTVDGEEQHHDKKSIFSRVKARAKRVKASIANRAHTGQGHDQDQDQDHEEDDDYEEIAQDPQVLDAPNAKNSTMGLGVNSPSDNPCSKPILETVQTKVCDTHSSAPVPSDAYSTGASASPTSAQVTDSNQSVPAPSAYDSVAPWDTSFDHDAKSGLKGISGEKFKDTNVPKGTSGDKFGEENDLVKYQQEYTSPASLQAKISELVTDTKNFAMGLDVNSTRDSLGSKPIPIENVCPGTFQTEVCASDSSVPPSAAKNFVMASDASSTTASSSPIPTQDIDSNQSAPVPSAPWDTTFDHDARSRLKGTLGEKFEDTNVPKGTLMDEFGEDTDLVKHQQDHAPPTSHHAKISEPVTDAKTSVMGLDVNSTRDSSVSKPVPGENVCPGTFHAKVCDSDSSVPVPSAAKSSATASDANSTRPSSVPTPTQVTDSNQSAPATSAPWDTSIDHDAKSGLKGPLGEEFKDTNLPKGTLGNKSGEDTDLVNRLQEVVSSTSHREKISEPLTVHESVSPGGHGVNSGNLKSPLGIPVGEQAREDDSLDTHKQQPREDVSPGNYHTKVTDTGANGGRDAGVSPILHSFDKIAIYNDPLHQREPVTTAGHDQSSASPIPGSQTIAENLDATTDNKHPQEISVEKSNIKQEGDSDKAGSGKDVIASKVEHDQKDDDVTSQNVADAYVSALEPPKEQQNTHTEMLSSATIASEFGHGGTDNTPPVRGSEITKGDASNVHSGGGDATVSGTEPQKPQSTYMGMLASKLGYGGVDNAPVRGSEVTDENSADVQSESEMNKIDSANAQPGGGVTGYRQQIASKMAGAGSAVLSKIPGIGIGTQHKTDKEADISANHETTAGEAEEENLVHEAVQDALHKCNADENMDREKMDVHMGKVTESEEVANGLGGSEEEPTGKVYPKTGNESPSTRVVDKFKGAFTNLFGRGGEANPAMANDPQGSALEQDNMSQEAGRRPQAN